MLNFSLSSVFMAILFSNLSIFCLVFIFRNQTRMLQIGFPLLTIFCILTTVRLCFPFELSSITTNIYFPKQISLLLSSLIFHPYWEWTLFGNFILEGSLWTLLQIIWFIGIIYHLYQHFKTLYLLYQYFHLYGIEVTKKAPYQNILASLKLSSSFRKKLHIHIIKGIASPCICKFWHYHILLPKDLTLSEQELFFILQHEIAHALHHDLTIKFIVQLLCNFYWWNPACKILQKQVEILLESRVDQTITSGEPEKTIPYLQCLIKIMEKCTQSSFIFQHGIAFSKTENSLLIQRFELMAQRNEIKKKTYWKFALLPICILYFLSLFYIFEPGGLKSLPSMEGITAATPENTFLIHNEDGTYHAYYNNHLFEITDSLNNFRHNYKIYDSVEEAEQEWGPIK